MKSIYKTGKRFFKVRLSFRLTYCNPFFNHNYKRNNEGGCERAHELHLELTGEKKDKSKSKRINALKKVVSNMTYGYDMSSLFQDVLACMNTTNLEIKKLCFLYILNYASIKPTIAAEAIPIMLRDLDDPDPLVRAFSLRTMSSIHVKKFWLAVLDPLVVANALAALSIITERSSNLKIQISRSVASNLLTCLDECSQWLQAVILDSVQLFTPQERGIAEQFADRILPWLQHANAAVCMGAVKAILYFTNYMQSDERVNEYLYKIGPPLVSLVAGKSPALQYVVLRNIQIILDLNPDIFKQDIHIFYCKYDDPIYIKLEKLSVLVKLADEHNLSDILSEFVDYATEIDVEFVRKVLRYIGLLALKVESKADECVDHLLELAETKITYVVQEIVIVMRDILRRYPGRYEHLISELLEEFESFEDAEAKGAIIWILGEYAERIDGSITLLSEFFDGFSDEPVTIQQTLLTAAMKLFLKMPTQGSELITAVLKRVVDESSDPDLRDKGIMYSRLLSLSPDLARNVVLSKKSDIDVETGTSDPDLTEQLLLNLSTLASVYHKPPNQFIKGARTIYPAYSPVLRQRLDRRNGVDEPEEQNESVNSTPPRPVRSSSSFSSEGYMYNGAPNDLWRTSRNFGNAGTLGYSNVAEDFDPNVTIGPVATNFRNSINPSKGLLDL
ncbi:AP-2 adaptor complex subunit Apl1 [Schizosaccharomyces japonicus yFS275]|uniref:AP complex subunit beta n=1 Tax=Schizosaccharomyces japonicus (strain yFS275 / FY16936) TaxID=402676 RepID=B6JXG5_SCHJY|nr:AP-2 adaptor complex subunit Apl1 [Schizosaccharomyces japonicus yFS275]EEB05109.1 AP-2 adaptor complex subunit Apl1 [Schizosaccharomyces japonicus yFS275]